MNVKEYIILKKKIEYIYPMNLNKVIVQNGQ